MEEFNFFIRKLEVLKKLSSELTEAIRGDSWERVFIVIRRIQKVQSYK